jgi:hypothetical protein
VYKNRGERFFLLGICAFVSYLAVTKATTPIRSNKASSVWRLVRWPPEELFFAAVGTLTGACVSLSLAAALVARTHAARTDRRRRRRRRRCMRNAPSAAQKVQAEAGGEMRQKDHLQKKQLSE